MSFRRFHLNLLPGSCRRNCHILFYGLFLALIAAACSGEHPQSVLHAASPEAHAIAGIWWFMLILFGLVFLVVMGLLFFGITRRYPPNSTVPGGEARFVIIGGMVIPGIILIAMLVYSVSAKVILKGHNDALTIEVTSHLWWWEVSYPKDDITIANEIYIPTGQPVRLQLKSADVIHSFWVPNLHGKMDMVPGLTNTFWIRAERPGVYRGQCAEFCGVQHAWMAFELVAVSQKDFANWVSERRRLATERAASAQSTGGHKVFMQVGCAQCHAIKGTDALGLIGPDLTHFGSRRTLAAGLTTNNTETLTRWIREPQKMKPGNLMPQTTLSDEELQTLVTYLQSLK